MIGKAIAIATTVKLAGEARTWCSATFATVRYSGRMRPLHKLWNFGVDIGVGVVT